MGPDRTIKNRLRHPDPWTLLGGSLLVRGVGDAIIHTLTPPVSTIVSSIVMPAAVVLSCAALIQLMRQRFGERASDYIAEVIISSGTIAIVLYALMIAPALNETKAGIEATLSLLPIAVALPQMVGALFLTWSFNNRPRSLVLLSVAQTVQFASAQFFFMNATGSSPQLGRVAILMFVLSATSIGLGAVDSAVEIHEDPTTPKGARISRPRLFGLVLPVVLGPILLTLSLTDIIGAQPIAIAAFSIVLSLLVVGHLLTMVQARASSTHWASHDKLTGLPNRALFRERIAQALDRSRKMGHPIAIMYLDLDRFKHINDSMGHEAGDQLLEQVARRILAGVDATDTVARLGGDEFAILISEVDDEELPRKLARRLLKAFSTPFNLKPRPVFMSPSIGIAISEPGMNLETVLTCADTAMYRAKECGRNNFAVWSQDMNDAAKNRLMLETSLHSAISNRELRLVYQPKVALKTGQVVGVEALIRWHHPKLGIISPGAFIHLAEETGLIIQIGEWVLVEACRQARYWYDTGYSDLSVAVNLSSRQFQQPGMSDLVARVLRETGLPSHLLELELTESMAMTGTDSTLATLNDLRQMGVKCSIDDFGTGYSNFSYLSRFPIDALKIDKSFVQSIDKSRGDASLVVAIIAMAHGLGMRTIGEGVETPEQVAFLTRHGCDEIQGFLFSKPLPPNELDSLLMLEHVSGGSGRLGLSGQLNNDRENAQRGQPTPQTVTSKPLQQRQSSAPAQTPAPALAQASSKAATPARGSAQTPATGTQQNTTGSPQTQAPMSATNNAVSNRPTATSPTSGQMSANQPSRQQLSSRPMGSPAQASSTSAAAQPSGARLGQPLTQRIAPQQQTPARQASQGPTPQEPTSQPAVPQAHRPQQDGQPGNRSASLRDEFEDFAELDERIAGGRHGRPPESSH